jgi:hypothetical protein
VLCITASVDTEPRGAESWLRRFVARTSRRIYGQPIWDLSWTTWHWTGSSPSTSVFLRIISPVLHTHLSVTDSISLQLLSAVKQHTIKELTNKETNKILNRDNRTPDRDQNLRFQQMVYKSFDAPTLSDIHSLITVLKDHNMNTCNGGNNPRIHELEIKRE